MPTDRRLQFRLGSSPRLRGTLRSERERLLKRGIIPALAGNTFSYMAVGFASWDHPRACGEHGKGPGHSSPGEGSSPRLRGTLWVVADFIGDLGIIPALAGNTLGGWTV